MGHCASYGLFWVPEGIVSTTVSNLSVPVSPSAKTYLLAVMNSAHSPESETNGNTEIFGQSKDKVCSLHLFSMVPKTRLEEYAYFFLETC